MRISDVQVIPVKPQNGLVGLASLVFDDCLYLGSLGIYTKPMGGYRLTYPTKKAGGVNVFHPISRVAGEQIERAVIAKFERVQGL
jgi:stage V sporulation protein G